MKVGLGGSRVKGRLSVQGLGVWGLGVAGFGLFFL